MQAELLAVDADDERAFAVLRELRDVAAQAFAAAELLPAGATRPLDTDEQADVTPVISARVLGAAQLQAQEGAGFEANGRFMAEADDVGGLQQLVSVNRDSTNEHGGEPKFLRGDTVGDVVSEVSGQRDGEHGRRLAVTDARAWWASMDSILLGAVMVVVVAGLVVGRARRRHKLKADEKDAADVADDEQQYVLV